MEFNIETIEADMAEAITYLPTIEKYAGYMATAMCEFAPTAPYGVVLKEGIAAVMAFQAVANDIAPFLAAGQKIETDFLAALATIKATSTTPTAAT